MTPRMELKVLFHDNCFDGAASAAVFSRFYKERIDPSAELSYEGLSHKAGGEPIDPRVFTGAQNAILDFRYSQDPRLTWWFDHHQSAFQVPGDEEHFRQDQSGKKFHDPKRKSCTKYLAEIAEAKFGFDPKPMRELIDWAELIDGAQFESPTQAVELKESALQLMTVLEANKDPTFIPRVIADLSRGTLSEVAAQEWVRAPLQPLLDRHAKAIEVIRRKATMDRGIVYFDIADEMLDSINKFISYYLYPDARYTVWVGRSATRSKISIGSNPWKPQERRHDLSKIAEKYGGGGHPVVAAISFKSAEIEKTRAAAQQILAELHA